jgi:hypothetical protein
VAVDNWYYVDDRRGCYYERQVPTTEVHMTSTREDDLRVTHRVNLLPNGFTAAPDFDMWAHPGGDEHLSRFPSVCASCPTSELALPCSQK